MGKVGYESDTKSQLVTQICNISNRAITCANWHNRDPINSPFIDWYLLLQVEENVGIDIIRKQYYKLALLLHPDKNKHPNAEIAFKLVSKAYACLSDNESRAAFDLARWNTFCIECNRTSHMSCNFPSNGSAKLKGLFPAERQRSHKISRGMKDIRTRFMEEARVIENCLKANTTFRKESSSSSGREFPLFNPSDYISRGYPHHRAMNSKKAESFWSSRTGILCKQGKEKCDSPIFEFGSERSEAKFKSVRISS